MSSPSAVETCVDASSVQSAEKRKEPVGKREDKQMASIQTDDTDIPLEDDDDVGEEEEYSTTLSVGDGHYLIDLGSPSEFIVDEDCILQLFKTCRKCNKRCMVRRQVRGLKVVVEQTCYGCQNQCKWTNLPGDGDGDEFGTNGKDAAHGQTDSVNDG